MKEKTFFSVGCVLMAAGNAGRFGKNKLMAVIRGRTLIRRAMDAVPADRLAAVCVVTQYDEVEEIAREYGFSCIRNDHPEWGQSYSARLGTEALRDNCDAILFMVADQPFLRRESLEELVDLWCSEPERIVSASHSGRRGNPCIFPGKYFPELCALTGDVGGSAVIRRHEDQLLLMEFDPTELQDIDTPEDMER